MKNVDISVSSIFRFTFFVSQNGTEKLLAQISRVKDDTSSDYARLYNPFLITIAKSPVLINYPYFYTGVSVVISSKVYSNFFSTLSSKMQASQPAITCSKLTIETLEQGVKYVQS